MIARVMPNIGMNQNTNNKIDTNIKHLTNKTDVMQMNESMSQVMARVMPNKGMSQYTSNQIDTNLKHLTNTTDVTHMNESMSQVMARVMSHKRMSQNTNKMCRHMKRELVGVCERERVREHDISGL